MKDIKAILFDLEGVVVDSEPIWSETDVEFCGRYGFHYDEDQTKHLLLGRSVVEVIRILQDQYGLPGDVHKLAAERKQVFLELISRDLQLIPGFEKFYESIKGKYRLAAATSAEHKFLEAFSKKLDLSKYFGDHIYSIEDIGFVSKPNPDIFLYAAKGVGVQPEHCLVFEDAPHGVTAAKAAGMRCIALTTTTTRERLAAQGADSVVDAYTEVDLSKPNFVRPETFSS